MLEEKPIAIALLFVVPTLILLIVLALADSTNMVMNVIVSVAAGGVFYGIVTSLFGTRMPNSSGSSTDTDASTDREMLDVLRRLCDAYAADNVQVINQLEPQATQIGEELNQRGGWREMQRLFEMLGNVRGARTLEMHWGGIGDWRG